MNGVTPLPRWQRGAVLVAALKILVALAWLAFAAVGTQTVPGGPRTPIMAANVLAFAVAAALLLAGARHDMRAIFLGVCLLLTASVFADTLVPFQRLIGTGDVIGRGVFALQVDVLWPYFLWRFVREFPSRQPYGALDRWIGRAATAALALGVVLFAANIVLFAVRLLPERDASLAWLSALWRYDHGLVYSTSQFVLALPALPIILLKTRNTVRDDRRRTSLLVAGMLAGTGPTILYVAAEGLFPAFGRALPIELAGWIVYPTLLATPFITAYAVLVQRALDVRLVVRQALQYALARRTVLVVAALPFLLLFVTLYVAREQSMTSLLRGTDGALLAALGLTAWASLRWRRAVLDRIDRRFFREQYDAQRILSSLVALCGQSTDLRQLHHALQREIERALHVQSFAFLSLDSSGDLFVSPEGDRRSLARDDPLLRLIAPTLYDLAVDLEAHSGTVAALPPSSRSWLADADASLIVPLRNAERSVIGLLVLGEKRSELPFSAEDRQLLASVASAASLALQQISAHPVLRVASTDDTSVDTMAAACDACGLVQRADALACERCGGTVAPLGLPLVVAGKFRLLDRAGRGAMGVVYRARDLHLDRTVALKTLPHMQPERAARLRREARAIASLSHPNLAQIFGGESWQGVPLLVLEYLAGGTLAERLARAPLPAREALRIGVDLADAVATIHRAGILHRDIKPSNIGFGAGDTPKLLDFGVARVLGRAAPDLQLSTAERSTSSGDSEPSQTASGHLVGTPLYLSPEAVRGEAPNPTFDLWALTLVLFEAISGRHPFRADTIASTLARIAADGPADLRSSASNMPRALLGFFADALAPNVSARPKSAEELREQLRDLLATSS